MDSLKQEVEKELSQYISEKESKKQELKRRNKENNEYVKKEQEKILLLIATLQEKGIKVVGDTNGYSANLITPEWRVHAVQQEGRVLITSHKNVDSLDLPYQQKELVKKLLNKNMLELDMMNEESIFLAGRVKFENLRKLLSFTSYIQDTSSVDHSGVDWCEKELDKRM